MNMLKALVGAAAAGTIVMAFRDGANDRWLRPAWPLDGATLDFDFGGDDEGLEEEPVLGYDGMDRDTLLDWLAEADLGPQELSRIRRYEEANLAREPVLDALDDLLG
jgi:hypothetical protein